MDLLCLVYSEDEADVSEANTEDSEEYVEAFIVMDNFFCIL